MTNQESKEICAKICDSQANNARTPQGEIRALNCAERIRAIQLPVEQDPVAFLWVMDNTEGIKENKPHKTFSFNGEKNPFGTPGEDYSKEYPVTCTPLYAASPPIEVLEKQVAELKESLYHMINAFDPWRADPILMRMVREQAK